MFGPEPSMEMEIEIPDIETLFSPEELNEMLQSFPLPSPPSPLPSPDEIPNIEKLLSPEELNEMLQSFVPAPSPPSSPSSSSSPSASPSSPSPSSPSSSCCKYEADGIDWSPKKIMPSHTTKTDRETLRHVLDNPSNYTSGDLLNIHQVSRVPPPHGGASLRIGYWFRLDIDYITVLTNGCISCISI